MLVDLQLNPATTSWPELLDGVRAADEGGFDGVWAFDHLGGSILRGDTMLECWTLVGALAAVTTRLGLGTMVANVANRPAGVLAAAASSAQAISGGRFRLGLGAGAAPDSRWAAEHHALGIPLRPTMAGRHTAVADALDLFDELWRDDRADRFAGFARPSPRPPVLLGVNSVALARLAGQRADGVNVRGDHPALAGMLAAAAEAHDGRSTGWEPSVWAFWDEALLRPDHPERRRWESLGVRRLVLTALTPLPPATIAAAARLLGGESA